VAHLNFSTFLFSLFLLVFGQASFAANQCVDLFKAPQTAVKAQAKTAASQNPLLRPSADEIRFAELSKSVERRLRGTTAEQRKSIQVPEFERFVTQLKRRLIIAKGAIPARHFLLHRKFSRLISHADSNLKQNSFIYSDVILMAMESSHIFTEALYIREKKDVTITPETYGDGLFTKVFYAAAAKFGNHLQNRDANNIIYNENTIVVPTFRALTLNDFLLVADTNVAYVGLVDTRVTYDGRVDGTPRSFLVHDFQHIGMAKPPEELQKQGLFINRAMEVAAKKPDNIRIAMGVLLFYYTHEAGQVIHEGTIQRPQLDISLKIIEERRSRETDMGDRPEVRKVLLDGHSLKEALQVLRRM
jgi:hypothetical protein